MLHHFLRRQFCARQATTFSAGIEAYRSDARLEGISIRDDRSETGTRAHNSSGIGRSMRLLTYSGIVCPLIASSF